MTWYGCPLAESLQHGSVALSVTTEPEVWPFNHTFRVKRIDNHGVKELFGRHFQKSFCDGQHDHRIRTGSVQQFDSIFNGRQNRRSELRTQHGDRMRIKGDSHRLNLPLCCQVPQRSQHHGMAQMNTVKVPDGHAAVQLRGGYRMRRYFHGSCIVKFVMQAEFRCAVS